MVDKSNITLYSTGSQRVIPCDMTLSARNNSNILNFESSDLVLELCLKDVVDLQDFYNLLIDKEKKIMLHSTLVFNGKEHKGVRKILMKNDNIAVSIGGIRLEFDKATKKQFLDIVKSIKVKMGV